MTTWLFLIVGTGSAQTVEFPDLHLLLVVERALDKTPGDAITEADMATLTDFDAVDFSIRNLTGLEYATNLTRLDLSDNKITDITPLTNLNQLEELYLGPTQFNLFAPKTNQITDITPLAGLNQLKILELGDNQVRDIIPLAGLTQLEELDLARNQIRDITPLANLTRLVRLNIWGNQIREITALTNLTQLTGLSVATNQIRDITPLTHLTQLVDVRLQSNEISNITVLTNLTQLKRLYMMHNQIRDITPLANLTQVEELYLNSNQIRDITPLANLIQLKELNLSWNQISDITVIAKFVNLEELRLENNPIQDTSPLCLLNEQHPTFLTDIRLTCTPVTTEYLLSVPIGINLIHIPLEVTTVDGMPQTVVSIADLYDVLGGAGVVNFLITYDSQTQEWRSYFGTQDTGTPADRALTDGMGIIASMLAPAMVLFGGNVPGVLPLGSDGDRETSITLNRGLNLVGLPLSDSRITRVSDLLALEGIRDNVPVIILTDDGEFRLVGQAGDPGDMPITGSQSFILNAKRTVTINISGRRWNNTSTPQQ